MTAPREASDGRARRSQRSRAAMVEALFELVGEGVLQPTAQQVAERAQVGIRTVFRHFSDMDSLLAEIDGRVRAKAQPLFREPRSDGSIGERMNGLVEQRIRIFEQVGPYKRSGNVQRWRSAFVARQHAAFVRELRANLVAWLPELRRAAPELVDAFDVALSFEVWDRLRTDQKLGRERAKAAFEQLASALLSAL